MKISCKLIKTYKINSLDYHKIFDVGQECVLEMGKGYYPTLHFDDTYYKILDSNKQVFEYVEIDFEKFLQDATIDDMEEALTIKVLRNKILLQLWKKLY